MIAIIINQHCCHQTFYIGHFIDNCVKIPNYQCQSSGTEPTPPPTTIPPPTMTPLTTTPQPTTTQPTKTPLPSSLSVEAIVGIIGIFFAFIIIIIIIIISIGICLFIHNHHQHSSVVPVDANVRTAGVITQTIDAATQTDATTDDASRHASSTKETPL